MRKAFICIFWADFFLMMLIPFIFVLSARLGHYEFLDQASLWASAWLILALIFAALSVRLGMEAKKNPGTAKEQKNNSRAVILITGLLLFGVAISFLKDIFSFNNFWDLVIVYWVVFMISLFRIMKDFIIHCGNGVRG